MSELEQAKAEFRRAFWATVEAAGLIRFVGWLARTPWALFVWYVVISIAFLLGCVWLVTHP